MLSTRQETTGRFFRFCAVGVGNTALDLALFWILTLAGVSYLLAQVLSYSIGVANSYILNRKWTFQVKGTMNLPEVVKFIMVNLLSLLASTNVLFLLHDLLHVDLGLSKMAAMASAPIINFVGNLLYVFAARSICAEEAS